MRNPPLRLPVLFLAVLSLTVGPGCGRRPRPPAPPTSQSTPASDSLTAWRVIGPGGGGGQFECTVSPFDPDFLFSRCDMTGAQVTYDGGKHWRMFNLRTVVQDFEFDPTDPDVVYASNTGLWRSSDRGHSWSLVYPDPKNILSERMIGDHSEQSFVTSDGMPDGDISRVMVDPADNNTIYIGLSAPVTVTAEAGPRSTRETCRVLLSTDRGASWRPLAQVPGRQVLALFPGSWQGRSETVTVLTDRACARLNSRTGEEKDLPLPLDEVVAADGGSGAEGSLFYILGRLSAEGDSISGGIYRSRDGGETWTRVLNGLLDAYPVTAELPSFKTLAVCRNSPGVVYLSARSYIDEIPWKPQRPQRDVKFGILKTENSGDQWRWVYQANKDTVWSNNNTPGWLNIEYGPEWNEAPHSIGVYPGNPDICYGTDDRTFVTRDGGRTWVQQYTDLHPGGGWSSRGIDVTTCYGVHFDPFDKDHFFISYTDIGLWHTFDGGKSWLHSLTGIPLEWINTTYWLTFDPVVRDRIFSVRTDCHDLPRLKMFRSGGIAAGQFQGGVAISSDGGRSWSPSNAGIPPTAVCTHILLDPESLPGHRTLYVCSMPYGVYKSTDDGANWRPMNEGLGKNRNAWRMERTSDGRLFLIVSRCLIDRKVTGGELYESRDGAASWRRAELPAGVDGPNDLICDPTDSLRMYLSCWPYPVAGQDRNGGLLVTADAGASWTRVFDESAHVYAAALDPSDPATLYINTFDSAAFVSHDRGSSWRRIKGYNFKYGHRPVPDPNHPGRLFLTTFGGSVFYGPAAGTAEESRDIRDGSFLRWSGM